MAPANQTRDGRSVVSREEFDTFERNTAKGFRDITDSLRELREDVKAITTRGPDVKAIISGISVFGTFVFAIGGIVAWGLTEKIDAMEHSIQSHEEDLDSRGTWIGSSTTIMAELAKEAEETRMFLEQIKSSRFTATDAREAFSNLDETLQREMRLLDEKVQNEMRLLDDHQNELTQERFLTLRQQVENLDKKILTLELDLQNRAGLRWNRPDHAREVEPVLEDHRSRLLEIEKVLAALTRKP